MKSFLLNVRKFFRHMEYFWFLEIPKIRRSGKFSSLCDKKQWVGVTSNNDLSLFYDANVLESWRLWNELKLNQNKKQTGESKPQDISALSAIKPTREVALGLLCVGHAIPEAVGRVRRVWNPALPAADCADRTRGGMMKSSSTYKTNTHLAGILSHYS